jgi:hypothetical protein
MFYHQQMSRKGTEHVKLAVEVIRGSSSYIEHEGIRYDITASTSTRDHRFDCNLPGAMRIMNIIVTTEETKRVTMNGHSHIICQEKAAGEPAQHYVWMTIEEAGLPSMHHSDL